MICPIQAAGVEAGQARHSVAGREEARSCAREECAWWISERGACAMAVLGHANSGYPMRMLKCEDKGSERDV
jgi:hypothetical protein